MIHNKPISQSAFKRQWRKLNAPLDWQDVDVEIITTDAKGYASDEQETSIVWLRGESVSIYTSDGTEITTLRRNKAFRVSQVTLNDAGRIIAVKGVLPRGNITYRSKDWGVQG